MECCDDGNVYHTLMAQLEALEKAGAAQAPGYKQEFGAGDKVFFANMRLALQSIKPPVRESEGESDNDLLLDHVSRLPSPDPPCRHQPLSQRSAIWEPTMKPASNPLLAGAPPPSAHTASNQSTGASRGSTDPRRDGWDGLEQGAPPTSFTRSASDSRPVRRVIRPVLRQTSFDSSSLSRESRRNSQVSFDRSVDFVSSLDKRTSVSSAGS